MLLRLATGIGLLALTATTALAAAIEGPLQIIVSRDQQTLKVYDGDRMVASTSISSGMPGFTTPTGIFSILEKKSMHYSNIYDEAPMPFMQRLTWSGIALHASDHVPDYPASHGCVRIPGKFARELFRMTRLGGHVLVAGREVEPRPIEHPALALLSSAHHSSDTALLSGVTLRAAIPETSTDVVPIAIGEPTTTESIARTPPAERVRILLTRRTGSDTLKDVQEMLNGLGYDAGVPDGKHGALTIAAIRAFQAAEGLAVDGTFTPVLAEAVFRKAGRDLPPNGKLFVRSNFDPILEGNITIIEPQIELGTHFLLARGVDGGDVDWLGVTMDNDLPYGVRSSLGIKDPGIIEVSTAEDPIVSALDRVAIPAELRQQIAALVGVGASITISDAGYEAETGRGTDFITLTNANGFRSPFAPSTTPRKKESSVLTIE